MRLDILGCAGSVTPERGTCSFRLGAHVLIEMGSAASTLSLAEQAGIDDILLTHAHLDHVKDLAFFAENVFAARETPVRVHAREETLTRIRTHLLNDVIWPDFTKIPSADAPTLCFVPLPANAALRLTDDDLGTVSVTTVDLPHPGGSVAYLLDSGAGVLVLCGDMGPTQAMWDAIEALGPRVRALLIETSFPDRLRDLAGVSGHLTPALLHGELQKLRRSDVPVYVHHIKAPTRAETLAELAALGDERIRILEPGDALTF